MDQENKNRHINMKAEGAKFGKASSTSVYDESRIKTIQINIRNKNGLNEEKIRLEAEKHIKQTMSDLGWKKANISVIKNQPIFSGTIMTSTTLTLMLKKEDI